MDNTINKICYAKIDKASRGQAGDPIRFRFTQRMVDRDSEVIEPKGVDLKNFKKNPIVLWSHNYGFTDTTRPAIGKVVPSSIEKTDEYIDGDIIFDVENDPFAKMIDGKIRDGFLSTGSIGFRYLTIGKEPVLPKQRGVTVIKSELREFSIVNIPANTGATRKQYEEFFDECEKFGKEYAIDRKKFFDDYADMFKQNSEPTVKIVDSGDKLSKEAVTKAIDSIKNLTESLKNLSGVLKGLVESNDNSEEVEDVEEDGKQEPDTLNVSDDVMKQFDEAINRLHGILTPEIVDIEPYKVLSNVAKLFTYE